MDTTPKSPAEDSSRWTLMRDIAVLQVKLIVDGFRDLLLVPASLIAGLISLLSGSGDNNTLFYRLVGMGKQSERWINLFGAFDNAPEPVKREYADHSQRIDDIVSKVESFVVEEYQKGGVTQQAKKTIDQALDELQRSIKRDDLM